jgi:transketolase
MNKDELERKAKRIRSKALEMCINAGKGHLGGSFSCTDILVALYYGDILNASPLFKDNPDRNRLIFSKGHAMLSLYVILGDLGFFDTKELETYGKNGTMLGDHPDHMIPGIEIASGSLGHGLSIACGLALSAKMNNRNFLTVAILGDAECNEGSVWEAAMFGQNYKLDNLIAVIDNNKLGATDFTGNFSGSVLMEDKWQSFGWQTIKIEGHNFRDILSGFERAKQSKDRPTAIIAETIKGKGVSFMENKANWHHGAPKGELAIKARQELADTEEQ